MKLTPQEKKVYDFILRNPGATTHDITINTYIQKPCARIVGLQKKGIEVNIIGEKRYPGSRPFKKYAIGNPLTKTISSFEYDKKRNCMREVKTVIAI